jgi:hypothetical protein
MRYILLIALILTLAFGAEAQSVRRGGGVTLGATATKIGNETGRVDLIIHNDSASTDAIYCGYSADDLSAVIGEGAGDKLAPGEGKAICVFADRPVYCLTVGTANVYYDEGYAANQPTPTP